MALWDLLHDGKSTIPFTLPSESRDKLESSAKFYKNL